MSSLFEQLEDAVITALTPLKLSALGGGASGYLRAVRPYQGGLDPAADDEDLNRVLSGASPAVLVTIGDGGSYGDVTLSRSVCDLTTTLEVLIISSNLRSPEAQARGDVSDGTGDDPGIYEIIEDVRDKLFGVEMGVDGVGFLIPSAHQAVQRGGDKAIWLLSFSVDMDAKKAAYSGDYYETIRSSVNNADDDTADPIAQGDIDL